MTGIMGWNFGWLFRSIYLIVRTNYRGVVKGVDGGMDVVV